MRNQRVKTRTIAHIVMVLNKPDDIVSTLPFLCSHVNTNLDALSHNCDLSRASYLDLQTFLYRRKRARQVRYLSDENIMGSYLANSHPKVLLRLDSPMRSKQSVTVSSCTIC
jgi:hypothetical protein